MRAVAVRRDEGGGPRLEGRVVCHDVRDAAGQVAVRKGAVIDAARLGTLLACPWEEVHVLELEADDLHEETAGDRIAHAAAGSGVEVRGYAGGQWGLAAAHRGLLRVREGALHETNRLTGIAVYTLYDLQPVEAGEVVARAKVTPLAVPGSLVKQAEQAAWAAGGLVVVRPFGSRVVGAVTRESLEPGQRRRFEGSLREKLDWFGSRLLPVRYSGGDAGAVAAEIEELIASGADLLVIAGASALDPLDPVYLGIERAGGRLERLGVPAHPGSLLFLAQVGDCPAIGMPTCGMFAQATTFDLLLPRLLAGEPVDSGTLAALGHGGLLSADSAWRFPPYRRAVARGELPE